MDTLWMTVSAPVPEALAEEAEGLLFLWGVSSVQTVTSEFLPPDTEAPPEGMASLIFYVPASDDREPPLIQEVQKGWEGFLLNHNLQPSAHSLSVRPLDNEQWTTAWRRFFHPLEIGGRVWIYPSWEKIEPPEGSVGIELDPGMAFGTGSHESTSLMLCGLIEEMKERPVASVLDVGCGSGILSIAAVKLGATHALGIDNDPVAVRVAKENVQKNGLDDRRVSISSRDASDISETYPLVLANIISSILLALKADLVRLTAPGGRLLLSGILAEEAEDVAAAFVAEGLQSVGMEDRNEWRRLAFAKPL